MEFRKVDFASEKKFLHTVFVFFCGMTIEISLSLQNLRLQILKERKQFRVKVSDLAF